MTKYFKWGSFHALPGGHDTWNGGVIPQLGRGGGGGWVSWQVCYIYILDGESYITQNIWAITSLSGADFLKKKLLAFNLWDNWKLYFYCYVDNLFVLLTRFDKLQFDWLYRRSLSRTQGTRKTLHILLSVIIRSWIIALLRPSFSFSWQIISAIIFNR